jgi:hypothetical protein
MLSKGRVLEDLSDGQNGLNHQRTPSISKGLMIENRATALDAIP